MKPAEFRVLLTGGAGGIGRAIAHALLQRGAAVLLTDRDGTALGDASRFLGTRYGERVDHLVADLCAPADRDRLCEAARQWRGGVNVLVNNAGISPFALFEDQDPGQIELALAVNLAAPIQLCHLLLPHLLRQPEGHVLNLGSVFGSIGYPAYSVYTATKFGIRGFSEALRRELEGTAVQVHYLAPRATRTPLNPPAVEAMNGALGVAMDPPELVAAAVVRLLTRPAGETVLGWPERLFVRLNGLWPRLVDRAIARQLPTIRRHARPGPPAEPPPRHSLITRTAP